MPTLLKNRVFLQNAEFLRHELKDNLDLLHNVLRHELVVMSLFVRRSGRWSMDAESYLKCFLCKEAIQL